MARKATTLIGGKTPQVKKAAKRDWSKAKAEKFGNRPDREERRSRVVIVPTGFRIHRNEVDEELRRRINRRRRTSGRPDLCFDALQRFRNGYFSGAITSSGGGIGYAAGAGGTVVQATSKSTGVTLNKICGQVTTNGASLAAGAVVAFTVTNSQVAAADTVRVVLANGNATAGTYRYWVEGVAAGSFKIVIENRSAGVLGEALVFNFAVLKGVNA